MVLADDRIADSIFQQIQPALRVILATLNLNGDYIWTPPQQWWEVTAPGATGENAAIFEATHGTALKHAGLDGSTRLGDPQRDDVKFRLAGGRRSGDKAQCRDRRQAGHLRPGPTDGTPGGSRELQRFAEAIVQF